jgi:hypothetical protein
MGEFTRLVEEALDDATFGKDLASGIRKEIEKIFPKSYLECNYSTNWGSGITIRFTLAGKGEWANNIIQNDDVFAVIMVRFENDKLVIESTNGFSIATKPDPVKDKYMAMGRHKVNFRKTNVKGRDDKKVLAFFKKKFLELKTEVKSLGDNIYHHEIAKGKV